MSEKSEGLRLKIEFRRQLISFKLGYQRLAITYGINDGDNRLTIELMKLMEECLENFRTAVRGMQYLKIAYEKEEQLIALLIKAVNNTAPSLLNGIQMGIIQEIDAQLSKPLKH